MNRPLAAHPATRTDAALLAPKLRAEDVSELKAARGAGAVVVDVLEEGIRDTSAWVIVDRAQPHAPLALFGSQWTEGPGSPRCCWMVAADDMFSRHSYRRQFIAEGPAWLSRISYGRQLVCNAHSENGAHLYWLERVGFTFAFEHPYGPYSEMFSVYVKDPPHV